MKVGLVLEGGAMRGMYTAGVLDIFLDHQIPVDGIIGVSAGVLFGVNYVSKQRGRALRYNLPRRSEWPDARIRTLRNRRKSPSSYPDRNRKPSPKARFHSSTASSHP